MVGRNTKLSKVMTEIRVIEWDLPLIRRVTSVFNLRVSVLNQLG